MTLTNPGRTLTRRTTSTLLSCAVFVSCAVFSSRAQAQAALDSPDVEACAAQIYRGARPLSEGIVDRPRILRTVLRTLSHVPACHVPADLRRALWLAYRRARLSGAQLRAAAGQALDPRYEIATTRALATPDRPECALGRDWNETWASSRACSPLEPAIRNLVTDPEQRQFAGSDRLLVVQVVDASSAASPRLMAIGAAYRVSQSKRIVRELEGKQRCLHCDSNDVRERRDGRIDCATCGQVTSAFLLSAKGPTEDELRALAKPSDGPLL